MTLTSSSTPSPTGAARAPTAPGPRPSRCAGALLERQSHLYDRPGARDQTHRHRALVERAGPEHRSGAGLRRLDDVGAEPAPVPASGTPGTGQASCCPNSRCADPAAPSSSRAAPCRAPPLPRSSRRSCPKSIPRCRPIRHYASHPRMNMDIGRRPSAPSAMVGKAVRIERLMRPVLDEIAHAHQQGDTATPA